MIIKLKALINNEYLKEYSLLPKNYNLDEVWNFVPLNELLNIIPIIGIDLYNELIDLVDKNKVTPANASLLLLIYPYECLSLMSVCLPYLYMHITEVGITIGKSENSESVSVKGLNYIDTLVKAQMNPLREKLISYIEANKDLYPLYKGSLNTSWNVYSLPTENTDVDGNSFNY